MSDDLLGMKSHGRDRDAAGRTPLHYAALEGSVAEVDRLLADGADPDSADDQGFTPLHLAAQGWSLGAAVSLLDAGSAVDAINEFGTTPLFTATFNSRGRGELIELLRERGADPFHENNSSQTPVGLARLIGDTDVARYFADLPE